MPLLKGNTHGVVIYCSEHRFAAYVYRHRHYLGYLDHILEERGRLWFVTTFGTLSGVKAAEEWFTKWNSTPSLFTSSDSNSESSYYNLKDQSNEGYSI